VSNGLRANRRGWGRIQLHYDLIRNAMQRARRISHADWVKHEAT
jgi:hypothetical protein